MPDGVRASRVFARRGMSGASIDEVAEDAGYTKGAFYANFKSKEELFLAMLDESFSERIAETEHAFATDESPPEQARHSAAHFAEAMRSDPRQVAAGLRVRRPRDAQRALPGGAADPLRHPARPDGGDLPPPHGGARARPRRGRSTAWC